MGKNVIMFGDIGAEKHTYHQHQGLVLLYDEKTFFGKKKVLNISLGTKLILKKVIPLCIVLPKMSAYRKSFEETKYMYFLIKDKLLEKYNDISNKVTSVLEEGFNSKQFLIAFAYQWHCFSNS